MKIKLPLQTYLKLKYYALLCEDEISGLGAISFKKRSQTIIVEDIHLLKQEVTGASTDLDKKAIALFLQEQHKKGINTATFKVWWHSHGDMGVFWSGTDDSTIEELGKTSDFLISIVVNKKGEMKGRIDLFEPFRNTLDDVPVGLDIEDIELQKQILTEIKEKVTKKTYINKDWNWGKKKKKKKKRKHHGYSYH